MKFFKILLFALALCTLGNLNAQDIHWTLFNMSPMTLNPALTGSYEGTFRVGGIYRDQYRSIPNSDPYVTPSAFADAPVFLIGKRDWVSAGVLLFQDEAGTNNLKTTSFQISGAFHHALDKKSNTVLSVGFQGGQVQRTFDAGNLVFEDGILLDDQTQGLDFIKYAGSANPGDPNANGPEKSFFDLNAGVLLKSKVNKTTDFNLGVSARHLTTPTYAFDKQDENDDGADLKMRFIAHGELNTELSEKWTLSPTFYFTNLSPATQFQLQGWAGYHLNPAENIKLNFGLGYRVGDAGQILVGMDYKDLKVAASYDVTLSSLNDANNYRGGFEIAAWYIFKIYKKPDVKPVIICPHL